MNSVEQFLQSHQIDYIRHEHPAVYTCEEAEKYCVGVPGLAGKNLFLTDKKDGRYFLVILPATKRMDLKKFAEIVSAKKLTFASPVVLKEKLGLEPGSVSPFGLLNDLQKEVLVYIDKEMYEAPIVNFHPNINTASLEISKEMFYKFFQAADRAVNIFSL